MKRDPTEPRDLAPNELLADPEAMSSVYQAKGPVFRAETQEPEDLANYYSRNPRLRQIAPHSLVAVQALENGRNFSLTPTGLYIHTKPSFRRFKVPAARLKSSRAPPPPKNRQLLTELRNSSKTLLLLHGNNNSLKNSSHRAHCSLPPELNELPPPSATEDPSRRSDQHEIQDYELASIVQKSMGLVPPPPVFPKSMLNSNIQPDDVENTTERTAQKLVLISPSAMRSRSQLVRKHPHFEVTAQKRIAYYRRYKPLPLKQRFPKKKDHTKLSKTVKLPDIKREVNIADVVEYQEEEQTLASQPSETSLQKVGALPRRQQSPEEYLANTLMQNLPAKPLNMKYPYKRRKKPGEKQQQRLSFEKQRLPAIRGSHEATQELILEAERRSSLEQKQQVLRPNFGNLSIDAWDTPDRMLLSPSRRNKENQTPKRHYFASHRPSSRLVG